MQVSVEGKMVEVSDGASCADALKEGLSGKRFKAAIACKAGDTLLDLTAPVPTTTETLTLTPVTADTPEGLGLIRHSAAHVMAAAVKKLFPAAKVTIGKRLLLRFRRGNAVFARSVRSHRSGNAAHH